MEFRLESDSMGDRAARVAKLAYARNLSLKEAVPLGLLSGEEFDRHVRPDQMGHP